MIGLYATPLGLSKDIRSKRYEDPDVRTNFVVRS